MRSDPLQELRERLHHAAIEVRERDLEPERTLELIEECARLASEAAAEADGYASAAQEPLPDLPGQLPLPAA